jgi:hypothetical protein
MARTGRRRHAEEVPLVLTPDSWLDKIYYFRWAVLAPSLVRTASGAFFSEFSVPVRWSGQHGEISAAVGHHLADARWHHRGELGWEVVQFWLSAGRSSLHKYGNWLVLRPTNSTPCTAANSNRIGC